MELNMGEFRLALDGSLRIEAAKRTRKTSNTVAAVKAIGICAAQPG
jgi:hypothetical protein